MTVNITLIVQMLNFAVAYLLLRRWLFKPAVQQILDEQHEKTLLEAYVAKTKEQVQKAHEYVAALQEDRHAAVSMHYPSSIPQLQNIFDGQQVSLQSTASNEQHLEQMKDEIVQTLFDKMVV